MARIHLLERTQRIDRPIAEVFPFYADAGNLERITPPWLGFEMITPEPIAMGAGALIEYKLHLHRVPIHWRTRIEAWDPPRRFVDAQLRGPYVLWHHTHTFGDDGEGGTVLGDRVRYALPFGPFGELAHAIFVRRDLERIFDFRRDAVAAAFGGGDGADPGAPRP